MALFNKLFSSRKKHFNKSQDNVCEKLFTFTNDQIRVAVFRECDFRGRKLLFDSHTVDKVTLMTNNEEASDTTNKTFVEVCNGHGYMYKKPNQDIAQLREMVFGSVAMSYRGTTYKIHSLSDPSRLICSLVFPSPKNSSRLRSSAPSHIHVHSSTTTSSLEQSVRLEDSGASSATCSDQSVQSTASDTLLVCRRQRSIPLDVPAHSSLVSSSGYGHSYSSISSGPQSIPIDLSHASSKTFSSGSLYKRWLRSESTSLEHSTSSVAGSISTDESFHKVNVRTSKIGLAVIIQLSSEQEEKLEQFLMDHAALIESMLWRVRQGVEYAYNRPNMFVSMMYDITTSTAQWFIDLLTGVFLSSHIWNSLISNCDNLFSIKSKLPSINVGHLTQTGLVNRTISANSIDTLKFSSSGSSLFNSFKSDFSISSDSSGDYTFLNLSRFLKSERDNISFNKKTSASEQQVAEKFVKELCELLETIDAKHTNFFISTLVTAVLTHHLGWVTTALPLSLNEKETIMQMQSSCKPLWGQLNDLYGAIGYPTKMSHTIISGSNKTELISKILNTLTYFIRCTNIKRKSMSRDDIEKENNEVDLICEVKACIPKENYKKYEDHLREIVETENERKIVENVTSTLKPTKGFGLTKTNTCVTDLNKLNIYKEEETIFNKSVGMFSTQSEIFNRVTTLGLHAISPEQEKSKMALFKNDSEEQQLIDINEAKQQINRIFSPKKTKSETAFNGLIEETEEKVVFVLGDDEKLVGLKRNIKRPTHLKLNVSTHDLLPNNIQKKIIDTVEKSTESMKIKRSGSLDTFPFNDKDFSKYNDSSDYKPSTSFTSLNLISKENIEMPIVESTDNLRAQSEPPTEKVAVKSEVTKYRYSGVKFNLQQYPQIVRNYMRSKNIELSNMQFSEKEFELNKTFLNNTFDFSKYEHDFDEDESLQTPSNASELEFTSDLIIEKPEIQKAKEDIEGTVKTPEFVRNHVTNTVIRDCDGIENPKYIKDVKNSKKCEAKNYTNLKIIELPMPKYIERTDNISSLGYTKSLMRGVGDHYISNMVLQGTTDPKINWESNLKKDLVLSARHPLLDQPIEESIAIVANVDTWEVQLMSSHTYIIDKNTAGVTVGMSQLVANMLESLLHMWRLHTPAEYCIMHIEQRLQEFCLRSKALAQLLLETDFCSMELLTSTLQLEVNDVPLLLAVASTHSPQVTQKYGLSFQ